MSSRGGRGLRVGDWAPRSPRVWLEDSQVAPTTDSPESRSEPRGGEDGGSSWQVSERREKSTDSLRENSWRTAVRRVEGWVMAERGTVVGSPPSTQTARKEARAARSVTNWSRVKVVG